MTDHLQIAYSYIEQYRKETERDCDPIRLRDALGFASKHTADARQRNPNAAVTIMDGKEEKAVNVDQLSAIALYYEASMTMSFNTNKALAAILKSINYCPGSPAYRMLAEIYVKQYKRPEALQAVRQALAISPDDIDAHKILDKMEANKNIGVKPPLYTNTLFLGFAGLGLIILGIYLLIHTGPIGVLVLLASGACFLAQRWYQHREIEDEVRGWKRRQL